MVRTWLAYFAALISTFVFFLCYKMWVAWYCLVLLLTVPVFAFILAVIASVTLRYKTEAPVIATIGKPAYIRFTLEGFAAFFSYCTIKTAVTDHMAGETKKSVLRITDSGVTKIPLDTKHCGAFTYKMSKIYISDLLGFFKFSKNLGRDMEFLVKPVPEMPGYMPDVYGFKAKSLRKSNKPNSEIYDIRDYQLGDPVKSIHWKMSAKKDKIMVKEPLEEYGGHSRVILKLSDDRDILDLHLGQVLFTSRFYLDHETSHIIRVIPPDSKEVAFNVESETDLQRALLQILHMRIPEEASHEKEGSKDEQIPEEPLNEQVSAEETYAD